MELWKYYRILRRRRWLILLGTIVCVGVVAALLLVKPASYEGTAAVMEQMPNSDKVTIFSGSSGMIDPKMQVANLAQLVQSERVRSDATTMMSGTGYDTAILKDMDVNPLSDSAVLGIRIVSPNRDEALVAVNAVLESFKRYYSELHSISSSRQYIMGELQDAEKRLAKARQDIQDFKAKSGTVSLQDQTQVLLQQIARLEGSATDLEVQAKEANARVGVIEDQLRKYPETRQASSVTASNPIWQSLKVELDKQELDLQKELQDRTPEHPVVKALQARIDETKTKLASTAQTVLNSSTESTNPIRDDLVQRYAVSKAEHTSAVSAQSAVQSTLVGLRAKLGALPSDEAKLAELDVKEQAAQNTYALLQQKYDEARIKEKDPAGSGRLEVVSEPASEPVKRNGALKLALALVLSPMLCSGLAFLLHYLDSSVRTPAEAEELLKLPVSAVVPMARNHSLVGEKTPPALGASYRMLSANLWIGSMDSDVRTILIASAEPHVGRSTTAANTAITLANDGARVILVDSDLRKPSLHEVFGLDNEKGLSNILAGQMSLRDALKPTSNPDLMVVTSGPTPGNPIRMLRSPEMTRFVNEINELADFVVFDSPSGIAFPDATLLASLIRNVVVVYAAGTVPRGSEVEFRSRLAQVQANILGVVLNKVNAEDNRAYHHVRIAYEDISRNGKPIAALPGGGDRDSTVGGRRS